MPLSATARSFDFQMLLGFEQKWDLGAYIESSSTTAAARATTVVKLQPATDNQTFDLGTLFPGFTEVLALLIKEITAPGRGFQLKLNGTDLPIRPGGAIALSCVGAPQVIKFKNAGDNPVELQISVVGS